MYVFYSMDLEFENKTVLVLVFYLPFYDGDAGLLVTASATHHWLKQVAFDYRKSMR